jgi:hypothetical protein
MYPNAQHVNIISFGSRECKGKAQNRGLMMHISHLPAERSCIGQFLDPETNRFIKMLHDARQTHWIINPLTPLGKDLSPYNSSSRYDRNKYFVNLNMLTKPEYGCLLKVGDLPEDIPTDNFTLEMLQTQKDPRFKKAFDNFVKLPETHLLKDEFKLYCNDPDQKWLENNGIYEGISSFLSKNPIKRAKGDDWRTWPDKLKFLPEHTKNMSYQEKIGYLKDLRIEGQKFDDEDIKKIEQFRFEQFLFDKPFKAFKEQLDENGIKLFVDLAYSVTPEGKDVWSHKNIVDLDKDNNYQPKHLTGCMPEANIPKTQTWGNAVWNMDSPEYWEYQEDSMRHLLKEGCVRLDHFGGLINRGAIPSTVTGKDGKEYSIFEAIENHIELQKPYRGFGDDENKPPSRWKADKDLWYPEWLEDVSTKTNTKGEKLIDMYLRVAREAGLDPQNAFMVEDLGGVCGTKAFKKVMEQYRDKLAGLRMPMQNGIGEAVGKDEKDGRVNIKNIDDKANVDNPYNFTAEKQRETETKKDGSIKPKYERIENIAMSSGAHDQQSLMGFTKLLLTNPGDGRDGQSNSPHHFRAFLKGQFKMTDEAVNKTDEKSLYITTRKILMWMYTKPARHVQTTISDALGIYFRPHIPNNWNGMPAKWGMEPTPVGQFHYWSSRFHKGFLDRSAKNGEHDFYGISPGYKERANAFVKLMQGLFGKPEKEAEGLDLNPVISEKDAKDAEILKQATESGDTAQLVSDLRKQVKEAVAQRDAARTEAQEVGNKSRSLTLDELLATSTNGGNK